MNFLSDLLIKTKLKLVIIGISLITSLMIFTGFYTYERLIYKQVLLENVIARAEILSGNIEDALIRKDTSFINNIIGTLKTQRTITAAIVFDKKGKKIAVFQRFNNPVNLPPFRDGQFWNYGDSTLILYHKIGIAAGTLSLSFNITKHSNRITSYMEIMLGVLLSSLVISYLLARVLIKSISNPLSKLSDTIKNINNTFNYSLRAETSGNDEIGFLAASFNKILVHTQQHESEMEKQNKALLMAEMRYRSTLDNMLEGCQIIGFDWTYIYLNDPACIHAGKTREQLIGYRMMDVYPGIEQTEIFNKIKQVMEEKIHFKCINEFKYPDGSVRWFSLVSESIPEGVFITSEDVTKEKILSDELEKHKYHLEDLVKERTIQLEAVNKELESFSYSVSHDLRAPLRHINGFTDLLRKNSAGNLDEKGKYYLGIITDASKQMGILIDDLLTFSRIGKIQLKSLSIDINYMVNDTILKFTSETEGRNIEWCIGNLPPIEADPTLFNLVFQNLIGNALKYTRTREKAVIEIGSKKIKHGTVFFVRDNGVGFDMRYCSRLFGVFQRLHSSTEFEGTGIGLANVHRIITKHGGRIWAMGEVDKGATFYFTLSSNNNIEGLIE
jgi:PAS domain S-box-containing protein